MTSSSPTRPPPAPDVSDSQWDSIEKYDVLEYDANTGTYRASFDSTSESVCAAVIATVAAVSETTPTELPSLYSVIDADAVEALVESTVAGPPNGDVHVSFTFNECDVTVHTYGIIAVQPSQEDASV